MVWIKILPGRTSIGSSIKSQFELAPPRAIVAQKYEDGLIFEEGDDIHLKVNFTGRPTPTVAWFHETTQLFHGASRCTIETGVDFTALKVTQARRSDRGEYSVKLQSEMGEDAASLLVTVASKSTYGQWGFSFSRDTMEVNRR